MSKIILLLLSTLLFSLISSYQTDGDVLVLKDQDFPKVFEDYPIILLQFYAPWCGHCKSLAPKYSEAATALKQKGSSIALAKVDATVHSKSAREYQVRGYPTLVYVVNGTQIKYTGGRTKQSIIEWTTKKSLPATKQLSNQDAYKALVGKSQVSIVLFSNDQSAIKEFNGLALRDDYSKYYVATEGLLQKESTGTVKIIRNFDEEATFTGDIKTISSWIAKNSRPILLPFDDRTIGTIFTDNKKAVILLNPSSEKSLHESILSQAKSHTGDLVFTELEKSNNNYKKVVDYIKIVTEQPKVVIIEAGRKKKYVQSGVATPESISEYVKTYISGSAKEIGLTDAVPVEQKKVVTQQL